MTAATVDSAETAVERLIKPAKAWEILSISQSKGYQLLAAGRIRSVLIDGARRIPESALRDFIAGLNGGEYQAH